MSISSIGKRIRKYRESKGWRQEDFAEKIGLSVTYTGMIERGEKIPKLETFITIANVLEVSADQILADVITVGIRRKGQHPEKHLNNKYRYKKTKVLLIIIAYTFICPFEIDAYIILELIHIPVLCPVYEIQKGGSAQP